MTIYKETNERRNRHGKTTVTDSFMGTDCQIFPGSPTPTKGRASLDTGLELSARDYFCSPFRNSLGNVASESWLRQWCYLLAALMRMATQWHMEQNSSIFTQRDRQEITNRLVSSSDRQRFQSSRFWGDHTGPNPTDRAKSGIKRHVTSDAQGIPLSLAITSANVHDTVPAIGLLDAIPSIQGQRGRPRKRPERFQGDRAYGSKENKTDCLKRGVIPELASLRTPHGSGLGKTRWVIERTQAWYAQFRRLKVCYERSNLSTTAFHMVATILIVWNAFVRL